MLLDNISFRVMSQIEKKTNKTKANRLRLRGPFTFNSLLSANGFSSKCEKLKFPLFQ